MVCYKFYYRGLEAAARRCENFEKYCKFGNKVANLDYCPSWPKSWQVLIRYKHLQKLVKDYKNYHFTKIIRNFPLEIFDNLTNFDQNIK